MLAVEAFDAPLSPQACVLRYRAVIRTFNSPTSHLLNHLRSDLDIRD
jgi:hypothetical protein